MPGRPGGVTTSDPPREVLRVEALSLRDFRGNVIHMDVAAADCFFCNLQAPTFHEIDLRYRDRDFVELTVLNESEFLPRPYIDPASCACFTA